MNLRLNLGLASATKEWSSLGMTPMTMITAPPELLRLQPEPERRRSGRKVAQLQNNEFVVSFEDWIREGFHLLESDRFEQALTLFDGVIEADARVAIAWMGRGFVLNELQRHEEAIDAFEQALHLDKTLYYAWVGLGRAREAKGSPELALSAYDPALAIDTEVVWAWYYRGLSLMTLEEYEAALASLDEALR
ncbi:tetratricopeptide repeat protein, partial [Geitlerinema sp. P-1104]|nr:tetratricopeptide repeat protein [Geitlerinema sp. P-1104]